ncbi:MAG: hypothetical protein V5A20_13355, partial [Salinibacter sp.]|uniref:hypothetical protein n=1 Tax=Salinibacter sp. TaxID=2065818 RepID=UPI002FC3D0BA
MRVLLVSSLFALLLGTGLSGPVQVPDGALETSPGTAAPDTADAYTETIPETLVEFDMVRVPGGSVTVGGTE